MKSFLENQGKNSISSKPFWQRIKKFRGENVSNTIPTLRLNNSVYETDEMRRPIYLLKY